MRDFIGKWGYTIKEIMAMPKEKLAAVCGVKYADMGNAMLRRTLRRETPDVGFISKRYMDKLAWRPDIRIRDEDNQATGFGWDETNILI